MTLCSPRLGHEAAAVLSAPGGLPRQTYLDLSGYDIGDEGARALADLQSLQELAYLRVVANGITHEGGDCLALSTSLVSLREVRLQVGHRWLALSDDALL